MRRPSWSPSIVPQDDHDVHLVVDDLGRLGRVWRETDVEATDLETVIHDMLDGQYTNPIGVFAFNPAEGWSRDVSEDVARELRRRCGLDGRAKFPKASGILSIGMGTMTTGNSHSGSAKTRNFNALSYLFGMRKNAFEPCLPTPSKQVPSGPDWIHEIKHDGYRLIVQREVDRVRLFTRNGHDWTDRYPLIVEAALRIRISSFVIDGEAVLLGVDGISDFNGLHSRRHNNEVQLYAFDILTLDGDDLRKLPLHLRKNNLSRLLGRRSEGICVSEFEQGEIGPALFRKDCEFGLEGLVSKRRDSPYRAGRSPSWVKVKNRTHPAMERVKESFK